MTPRRRLALVCAVATSLPCRALADPSTHLKTPSSVKTDGGTDLRLPPGYFLDEPAWGKLDAETRRLQETETRLTAENRSLRKSAREVSFGWKTLSAALVLGFAAGAYAATR